MKFRIQKVDAFPQSFALPEYQAVYDAMPVKPSAEDAANQLAWLSEMVNKGYFAKAEFIDFFCVHAGGQLIDWKNPTGTHNPTEVNSPVFEPYKGYTGSASPVRYLRLHYNPYYDFQHIAPSAMAALIGVGTQNHLVSMFEFGGNSALGRYLRISSRESGAVSLSGNGTPSGTIDATIGIGHCGFSRYNGVNIDCYQNMVMINNLQTSASSLLELELYGCGINNNNVVNPSNNQVRYIMLFSYLTEYEMFDIIKLTDKYLEKYDANLMVRDASVHPLFTRISTKNLTIPVKPNAWTGRPFTTVNALGEWVMCYRQSYGHNDDTSVATTHIRFSDDEGLTWTADDTTLSGAAVTNFPLPRQAGNTNQGATLLITCANGDLLALAWETGTATGSYQWRSTDDGATWALDGLILGGLLAEEQHCIVGTDIYMLVRSYPVNPEDLFLYRSTDNGATWGFYSNVETSLDTNEAGICYLGGTDMMVVMKDSNRVQTWMYLSNDLGLTWTRSIITDQVGFVDKPMLYLIGTRIFLIGRNRVRDYEYWTGVWVTTDNGTTWSEVFHPDEYAFPEGGYCSLLPQRSDGSYYIIDYSGAGGVAQVKEHIFEDI